MLLEKISKKKVEILDQKDKNQIKGGNTDIFIEDMTIP